VAKTTRERAARIARAHACEQCREYSYKKVTVKPASAAHRAEFHEAWHVVAVCGVCGLEKEMGIDADGEIVYVA
jgi:transcription elongation factor Elf1